jgi:hypothetical protein
MLPTLQLLVQQQLPCVPDQGWWDMHVLLLLLLLPWLQHLHLIQSSPAPHCCC